MKEVYTKYIYQRRKDKNKNNTLSQKRKWVFVYALQKFVAEPAEDSFVVIYFSLYIVVDAVFFFATYTSHSVSCSGGEEQRENIVAAIAGEKKESEEKERYSLTFYIQK